MSEAIGSRPTSAFRRINCYGSSTRLLRDRFGPLSTTENCDSRKDDNSATCGLRSLRDEDCGSPSAQIDACACTHAALAVDQSQHNCLPHIIYSPGICSCRVGQGISSNLIWRRSPFRFIADRSTSRRQVRVTGSTLAAQEERVQARPSLWPLPGHRQSQEC